MNLFKHQKTSVKKLLPLERTADWSDPGTGKTLVTLELIRQRKLTALVVCPKTLMEVAWIDDAAKFTPELVVIPSYAPHKEELFNIKANIFVINVDAAVWLSKRPRSFFAKFDMLVLDESSKFKHHTSKRSRALNKIKRHFFISPCYERYTCH